MTNDKKVTETSTSSGSTYRENDIVAVMKTTNGTINIALETELSPFTANNFIGLAKEGYYNGIIFHRVIKDFMIQGGDPTGTGMGGESLYGAKFDDEFNPALKNNKYTIAMANSGKNTNGSQFFINVANNNYLDNKHSVFGRVVEGFDNVDKISKVKTDRNDKPEKEVKIISIDIKQYKGGSLKDYNFDSEAAKKLYNEKSKVNLEAKKGMLVASGSTVSVNYTGTYENKEKFDSSYDRGTPLEFVVGAGMMIPGFDKAVLGMKIGEKKSITLQPVDAYGERNEDNIQKIPKENLVDFENAGFKLEKGTVLPTQIGNIEIMESDESTVTVDGNHPMAGKVLNFDIEIVDIK
ncbi:MAG: peptidylprolyl isomerase [Candidatus Gracilibacteria bacterium]|nr:peptidylprolyl isomerase [Candidatus Gracilibacteria bacterium]